MLIILIDRWQLLSYLIRMEVNASKEEKTACPLSSLTPRRKKMKKSFCKVWASKLAESNKGSYYNQEKCLKDEKASEKNKLPQNRVWRVS